MKSIIGQLFVSLVIRPEYAALVAKPANSQVIAEKLGVIYTVSHVLGTSAAVAFVKANDPIWGRIAVQVVDAVNGHMDTSAAIIGGILARQASK